VKEIELCLLGEDPSPRTDGDEGGEEQELKWVDWKERSRGHGGMTLDEGKG